MRIIEDCSDGGRLPRSGFVQQGGPQGTTYSGAGSKDVAYFLVLYLGMVQCSLSGDPITATLCVERLSMLTRITLIVLLLAPAAGWVFYKPMRVLAPGWNGVTCISEEVCVEDLTRAEEANSIYELALSFVNSSVGVIRSNPRVTFCFSVKCFKAFGFRAPAKAKTVGVFGIVVGPSGWNEYILRHEIVHHLQSEQLGVMGQWPSPKWFKEGMAYSLSQDPRQLAEPMAKYREQFDSWRQRVGKEGLWKEAKKL
jgi:hypothetical protein